MVYDGTKPGYKLFFPLKSTVDSLISSPQGTNEYLTTLSKALCIIDSKRLLLQYCLKLTDLNNF